MKILFVCLGNICRSPLAEAIFTFKIRQIKKEKLFSADSCGLSNYHADAPADRRAVAIARQHGIEINHKGRQIESDDFEKFDYILVMDRYNYTTICRLAGAYINRDKILLIRHFDSDKSSDEVPDPYYGDKNDFQEVFDTLSRSIEGFISYLRKQYNF